MTGWRAERGILRGNALLGNYSLFRYQTKKTTLGLETNYKTPGATGRNASWFALRLSREF